MIYALMKILQATGLIFLALFFIYTAFEYTEKRSWQRWILILAWAICLIMEWRIGSLW